MSVYQRLRDHRVELAKRLGCELEFGTNNQNTIIQNTICAVTTMLSFNHMTKLVGGHVKVNFTGLNHITNEEFEIDKPATGEQLVKWLITHMIRIVDPSPGDDGWVSYRYVDTGASKSMPSDEIKKFIQDPMGFLPPLFKDEFITLLNKKIKSINKNFTNFDNKVAKRTKGKNARAMETLSECLATVKPELRDALIFTLKHCSHDDVATMLTATEKIRRNLSFWNNDEIIQEASALAEVKWVMNK